MRLSEIEKGLIEASMGSAVARWRDMCDEAERAGRGDSPVTLALRQQIVDAEMLQCRLIMSDGLLLVEGMKG